MLAKLINLFSGLVSDKKQDDEEHITETADEQTEDIFRFAMQHEIKPFDHKFPLQKDDIIVIRGGRNYKVCVQKITGAITNITVTLKWLNKPVTMSQKDNVELIKFRSLRELNYYVQREKEYIEDIIKVNWYAREDVLSIEDCHELANRINEEKQRFKRYLDTRIGQRT